MKLSEYKRYRKERSLLEDTNTSNDSVRKHYGFKRLTEKAKTRFNLPKNTSEGYTILAQRRIQHITQTLDTDSSLSDMMTSRMGVVQIHKQDKWLLQEVLSKPMNFTPTSVLKIKTRNTYYTIGNNKARRKLLKALQTDFESVEEQISSDAKLMYSWENEDTLQVSFGTIKGKIGGAFFDKVFKRNVGNDFTTLSTQCKISKETSYAFINDDNIDKQLTKLNKTADALKKDCFHNDNCLQQAITQYVSKHIQDKTEKDCVIKYLDSIEGKDIINKTELKECDKYNLKIELREYHTLQSSRLYVFGKGSIVLKIALINKHYIPILTTNMTSYYLEHYKELKWYDYMNPINPKRNLKNIVAKYKDGGYRHAEDKYLTTDKVISIMLKHANVFFAEHDTIFKMDNFVSEDANINDVMTLQNNTTKPRVVKEKKEYNYKLFACDFETYYHEDNQYQLIPILCSVKHDDITTTFFEKDGNCARALLDYICSQLQPKELCKIIFHNLKFDMGILMSRVAGLNPTFVIERGGMLMSMSLTVEKNKTLSFQDSMAYLNMRLSSFADTFQLNVKKEILPYHYYKEGFQDIITVEMFKSIVRDRHNPNALKQAKSNALYSHKSIEQELDKIKDNDVFQAIQNAKDWGIIHNDTISMLLYNKFYCEMDCEVLFQGLMKFNSIMKVNILAKHESIFSYMSISSMGDNFMRRKKVFEGICDISGITRRFISKASCGGRVQTAFNQKIYILLRLLADFDGVSLYPSSIVRLTKQLGGVLKGKPKIITTLTKAFLDGVDGYFVEIKILNVKKERAFSVLGLKLEDRRYYNDGALKDCYVVVDKITLEMLIDYNMIDYEIIQGYYFDEGRNELFGTEIERLFHLRLQAKKEGNKGLDAVYKTMMNSCYGSCGMKANDYNTFYTTKDKFENIYNNQASSIYRHECLDNDLIKYDKANDINEHFNAIHVSCEILSMSKLIMNEIMFLAEDNGINIYYTDTDSMHIEHKDIEKLSLLYQDKFKGSTIHNNGVLVGKKLGQFHSDFSSELLHGDLVAIESIFLGSKCYVDKLTTLTNVREDNTLINTKLVDYHIRAKGVNLECIERKAKEDYGGDVMLLYKALLHNEVLHFDLSCDGNKASFKTSNFKVINNFITRNVKFEGLSYDLYDDKGKTTIQTILTDDFDYKIKQKKIASDLKAIRRF